ncbi:MAG: ribonuclease P protein component [Eubacterium sp.]|nr:ribonuclease P protein component [Eubacterium sp.]MBR4241509.1 ribonuclease P protein component [Eubacterium sp.]MBR7060665.1 ribonuclease P protein component [Eubacterium sp.]
MKSQTLKENKDFRRLYYRAESKASKTLVTYAMKSRGKGCRYGITTSKKIGNAVERNRSRRVIRAAYSELEGRISGNWDFVFVARHKTSKVKMQEVLKDMEYHFKTMGVIDEND